MGHNSHQSYVTHHSTPVLITLMHSYIMERIFFSIIAQTAVAPEEKIAENNANAEFHANLGPVFFLQTCTSSLSGIKASAALMEILHTSV